MKKTFFIFITLFSTITSWADIHPESPEHSSHFIKVSQKDGYVGFKKCEYSTGVCTTIGPKPVYSYDNLQSFRRKQLLKLAGKEALFRPYLMVPGASEVEAITPTSSSSLEKGTREFLKKQGGVLAKFEKITQHDFETKVVGLLDSDVLDSKILSTNQSIEALEADLTEVLNGYVNR